MPPRTALPRPHAIPEWSALLLHQGARGSQSARKGSTTQHKRSQRPASLSEALVRFVDRNWD